MGSSKKQTIGYRYFLGLHMILCHGPIDCIKRISVDKRVAWRGSSSGGRINVVNEGLFGGTDREGGVNAPIDLEMGSSTQTQNDYLQKHLGTDIPAFRGVVGAVFRKAYLSMNPYLKPWAFRGQRVYTGGDGNEQWNVGKAGVGDLLGDVRSLALYIALDTSGSMDTVTSNDSSRLLNAKQAITSLLTSLKPMIDRGIQIDLSVVGWDSITSSLTYYNVTKPGIDALILHTVGLDTLGSGGTFFATAVSEAPGFFGTSSAERRVILFLTDGEPTDGVSDATAAGATVAGIPGVECFGINIDLNDTSFTALVDNTPNDGVPVVNGGGNTILGVITQALTDQVDMNPAHIIRECLINREWGLGYLESDLDLDSFVAAADTYFSEQMGISLLWDSQVPIEDFIQEVIRHSNSILDIDKSSGKFKLKPIRDDYILEDLLILNETNILKLKDYSRQATSSDVVNSVTVKYWDYRSGETASTSIDDLALIQDQGGVVGTTIQYPGFTRKSLASQAAQRDLRILSSPLLSCTILANREAAGLATGDVFKLEYAKNHSGYVVMRVMEIAYGSSKSNQVKIKAMEDVFALPSSTYLSSEDNGFEDLAAAPAAATARAIVELPYYELVQSLGQTDTDARLTDNPDMGFIGGSAARPSGGALSYNLAVDAGIGYEETKVGDFCPAVTIPTAVTDRLETVFAYEDGVDLDLLSLGVHGYWEDEIVRLDAIDTGTLEITIGRGCLDTVPTTHSAASTIVWWDEYVESNEVEYIATESINTKLLVTSGSGVLAEADAPTDTVVMDSRAYRPYPPANFKINGAYFPTTVAGNCVLTWNQRNRLQQTGPSGILSYTESGVTPEPGTTYTLVVTNADTLAELDVITGITGDTHTVDIGTYASAENLTLELFTERDGYRSYRAVSTTFQSLVAFPDVDPIIGVTDIQDISAGAVTLTVPAGAQTGDKLLVVLRCRGDRSYTIPAEWTTIVSDTVPSGTSTASSTRTYIIQKDWDAETDVSFTQSTTAATGACLILIRGEIGAPVESTSGPFTFTKETTTSRVITITHDNSYPALATADAVTITPAGFNQISASYFTFNGSEFYGCYIDLEESNAAGDLSIDVTWPGSDPSQRLCVALEIAQPQGYGVNYGMYYN